MRVIEKSRREIEEKLGTMSDFLKIDYLESALKSNIDLEAKKFCHLKLAEMYEAKKMFTEAAKNMLVLSSFAITYKDQVNSFMKETELWIKAGMYERADESFKKALASGNSQQKIDMKSQIKTLLKNQAIMFEQTARNANASKCYEKLLEYSEEQERMPIRNKLFAIYTRLGKIREATMIKNQISKPTQETQQQRTIPSVESRKQARAIEHKDDAEFLIGSI